MPPACKRAKANTQSKTRAKKCSPTVIQVKYKKRIDKENRQLIQKKVIIDFEKPLALVSKYRSLGGLGIKNKKRDEEQKMLVVSSCRNLADVILTYYKQLVNKEANLSRRPAGAKLRL